MLELFTSQEGFPSLPLQKLLSQGESVAVVDDSPEIVVLLSHYLQTEGFNVLTAASAAELYALLTTNKIALILLDIELPDKNGNEIIQNLRQSHPNTSIIMVTGTTDLDVALDCLRMGADDYLTKPVSIDLFHHSIKNSLKKRRLAIDNRQYQGQLQKAHSQMQFLHHLNLKMNTAYLNTVELAPILQAILVGITSDDGLKFNRAFMALYNEEGTYLEGKLAIGPASREDAGKVWESIKIKGLQLDDILTAIQNKQIKEDVVVNKIVKTLRVPTTEHDHILIFSSRQKKSIRVIDGEAEGVLVSKELTDTLGEDSFIVVPLYSPTKSLGVIIVDNFITRSVITAENIAALEIFASEASLAIEHSHLYEAMVGKIAELEIVTDLLEQNRNLLIDAERSAAIGQMAAQLAHAIRNPLTSIGGTSRLLSRKTTDPYIIKFLNIITKETIKIESTLEDLFSVVEEGHLSLKECAIFPLIRKSVMTFYTTMKENKIKYILNFDGDGPLLLIDEQKMRQAFFHLIRNSIEAMVDGGNLRIEAVQKETRILISFLDSGTDIPPDTLEHVKDPFFTTKTYGNGMGLTLVDRIVNSHGGDFTLQTAANGGTEALISLPIANSTSQSST